MTWLDRLKAANARASQATKPTEPGFVGFVACPDGSCKETPPDTQAANNNEAFEERAAILEFDAGMSRNEAEALAAKLLQAAMRACDYWGDGQLAREEMQRQCLETPVHLRPELLAHLDSAYPANKCDSG